MILAPSRADERSWNQANLAMMAAILLVLVLFMAS
jgi:hypothetical protein